MWHQGMLVSTLYRDFKPRWPEELEAVFIKASSRKLQWTSLARSATYNFLEFFDMWCNAFCMARVNVFVIFFTQAKLIKTRIDSWIELIVNHATVSTWKIQDLLYSTSNTAHRATKHGRYKIYCILQVIQHTE